MHYEKKLYEQVLKLCKFIFSKVTAHSPKKTSRNHHFQATIVGVHMYLTLPHDMPTASPKASSPKSAI